MRRFRNWPVRICCRVSSLPDAAGCLTPSASRCYRGSPMFANHPSIQEETTDNNRVQNLLRRMAVGEIPRNRDTMSKLAALLSHPRFILESRFLADEDSLKTDALMVMERMEAVCNGMPVPEAGSNPMLRDHPLYPWTVLIDAIEAFYRRDEQAMLTASRGIPENTPPANLKPLFERLSGKPGGSALMEEISGKLLKRQDHMTENLATLEEAAAYPHMLRSELARLLPAIASENETVAARLYLWAMKVLTEEAPLTEEDLIPGYGLPAGEPARLCALASLEYDPDRALLFWLRSLAECVTAGTIQPPDALSRLSTASEMLLSASAEEELPAEILHKALDTLTAMEPMLGKIIPALPKLPEEPADLPEWLRQAGQTPPPGKRRRPPKSRRQTAAVQNTFLFGDESEDSDS